MARPSLETLRKLRVAAEAFLDEKVFILQDESRIPRVRRFLHFWMLAGRQFARNRCPAQAAALAYTTLLALVPVLAVVVSVSTGFLKQEDTAVMDAMIDRVIEYVAAPLNLVPHPDEMEAAIARHEVVTAIKRYIENINTGTLGLSAMLVLLFVAIGLLNTIEATFNDIWGVARGRRWVNRVVQYWAALSLGPVLLLMAVGLITGQEVAGAQQWIQRLPWLGSLVFFFLPFVILTIACALLYLMIPNTKVTWRAALFGGAVAGCLLQLNTTFSVVYISRVVAYHKIYGSLGLVPLFLVGLYISWIILLFGAQVAYALQNRRAYLQEKQAELVNQRGREFIALRIMALIAWRFQAGQPPPTLTGMADQLGVSSRLITLVLKTLSHSRLVVEVAGPEPGYSPARPIEQITVHDVLLALRAGQGHEPMTCDDPARQTVRRQYDAVLAAEDKVAGAVTLKHLIEELAPATEDDAAVERPTLISL